MSLKTCFAILVSLFVMQASAGYAQTKTRKVPVDNGWARADFQWNGGGRILIRYKTFDLDGNIELCVASSYNTKTPFALSRAVLKEAKIVDGTTGDRIKTNLSFSRTSSSKYLNSGLVGRDAQCINTKKVHPGSGFFPKIVIRSGRYTAKK